MEVTERTWSTCVLTVYFPRILIVTSGTTDLFRQITENERWRHFEWSYCTGSSVSVRLVGEEVCTWVLCVIKRSVLKVKSKSIRVVGLLYIGG